MLPEVDETLYLIKIKILNLTTLAEQLRAGADTVDLILDENREIYETIETLQKLLK